MINGLINDFTDITNLHNINADNINCETILNQPSTYFTGIQSNIQSQINNINTNLNEYVTESDLSGINFNIAVLKGNTTALNYNPNILKSSFANNVSVGNNLEAVNIYRNGVEIDSRYITTTQLDANTDDILTEVDEKIVDYDGNSIQPIRNTLTGSIEPSITALQNKTINQSYDATNQVTIFTNNLQANNNLTGTYIYKGATEIDNLYASKSNTYTKTESDNKFVAQPENTNDFQTFFNNLINDFQNNNYTTTINSLRNDLNGAIDDINDLETDLGTVVSKTINLSATPGANNTLIGNLTMSSGSTISGTNLIISNINGSAYNAFSNVNSYFNQW